MLYRGSCLYACCKRNFLRSTRIGTVTVPFDILLMETCFALSLPAPSLSHSNFHFALQAIVVDSPIANNSHLDIIVFTMWFWEYSKSSNCCVVVSCLLHQQQLFIVAPVTNQRFVPFPRPICYLMADGFHGQREQMTTNTAKLTSTQQQATQQNAP